MRPHHLASAFATKSRIASGRLGLTFCRAIHTSSAAKASGSMRTPITWPVPVLIGLPRLFALTLIDFAME